jgi:hypothetical protein
VEGCTTIELRSSTGAPRRHSKPTRSRCTSELYERAVRASLQRPAWRVCPVGSAWRGEVFAAPRTPWPSRARPFAMPKLPVPISESPVDSRVPRHASSFATFAHRAAARLHLARPVLLLAAAPHSPRLHVCMRVYDIFMGPHQPCQVGRFACVAQACESCTTHSSSAAAQALRGRPASVHLVTASSAQVALMSDHDRGCNNSCAYAFELLVCHRDRRRRRMQCMIMQMGQLDCFVVAPVSGRLPALPTTYT